jgi:hypothetical protein
MAFSKTLITTGVPFVSAILYVVYIGYRRRSRVNELRKQGVVSTEVTPLDPSNELLR